LTGSVTVNISKGNITSFAAEILEILYEKEENVPNVSIEPKGTNPTPEWKTVGPSQTIN
jgi:hypothetical protein